MRLGTVSTVLVALGLVTKMYYVQKASNTNNITIVLSPHLCKDDLHANFSDMWAYLSLNWNSHRNLFTDNTFFFLAGQ